MKLNNKPQLIILLRTELVLFGDGRAAGAGADALLEGLDGDESTGTLFILPVAHGKQGPVSIGLDAQFKGLVHSQEGNRRLSIGNAGPGAVAAVAALLGPEVGLGHILDPTGNRADGELILHVDVAFPHAAGIFHLVKGGIQAEGFAEPGQDAATLV